jgi:pimeloyl-ACP methyl ester carboxylesterase
MHSNILNRLLFLLIVVLCACGILSVSVRAQAPVPPAVKELNFVFLHGAGGNSCSLQLLNDSIMSTIPGYIRDYQQANPGIRVQVDSLLRCYPNDVDIKTWAENIANSINENLPRRKNLILIGHSMGGKAALYAVANNIGGLAGKVAMVATINSPVKSLGNYYFTSGVSLTYIGTPWLISDHGVINSLFSYDSSPDGGWVGRNKHWLAFISAENAPLSQEFDVRGVDALPRNMDDTIVPISAQYAEGADVVYYGEHAHSEFGESKAVSGFMANQILNYIFGGRIGCSVLERSGTLEHAAGWLPRLDRWQDLTGEVLLDSGTIQHSNESYFRWQDWDDVVGKNSTGIQRSSFNVSSNGSLPLFAGISSAQWFNAADIGDCRLNLKTRAAPKNSIRVDWSTSQPGLLPEGAERDRYEIEIVAGTPFTAISDIKWVDDNPRDMRLLVASQAEGPFRWFQADWKVFSRESRKVGFINDLQ